MLTRSQRLLPANQLLEFQKKQLKGEILYFELFITAIQNLGNNQDEFLDAVEQDFETTLQSYRSIDENNPFVAFYEMYQSKNVDLNSLCRKDDALGSFKKLKKYLEGNIRSQCRTIGHFFSEYGYAGYACDAYECLFNTVDRYFENSTFRDLLATNYKLIIGLEELEIDCFKKYCIVRFSKHGKETIYDSGIKLDYNL